MITVAGLTPSLDITYLVPTLRPGAIHRPSGVFRCAGGKALNLARAAATVGSAPAVVAVLGGPTGAALSAELAAAGIEVVAVWTPVETRVCVSIAADDVPGLTEIYSYADPLPAEVWSAFVAELDTLLIARPGWLAVPGGPPRGADPDTVATLVRQGRARGCRVAVDTHGAALAPAIAAGPALVKINRSEAAELLGRPVEDDLAAMAAAIRDQLVCGGAGPDAVVILTDGQHGSLGLCGDQRLRAQPLPEHRTGLFPVGSGDAFLGGLLTGLDRGEDLREALALATAAGAANAAVPGAGRFEAVAVEELVGEVEIAEVEIS